MESKTWQPRLQEEYPESFLSINYANNTVIQTVEVLHYSHSDQPQLIEGTLNDETLPAWFEKDLSSASAEIQPPPLLIGGFRLLILSRIYLETGGSKISITPKGLSIIHKHIDIERFTDIYVGGLNRASLAAPEFEEADVLPVFWASFVGLPILQTLLAMNALSRRLTSLIKSGKFNCNHHLNLIGCISQISLEQMNAILKVSGDDLSDIKADTGQHDFNSREEIDLSTLDYGSITTNLNKTGQNLGLLTELLEVSLFMLEKIREWDIAVKNHISEVVEIGDNHGTGNMSLFTEKADRRMDNKLRYLKDYGSSMLLNIGRNQDLVQLLNQAVYQFGAQKDARVNIELAKSSAAIAKASREDSAIMRDIAVETKRDSTAMKTIAVLTMFFLPGTFIAAVFAMPVLDWTNVAPSSLTPTIRPGFKCYWAITVPLTLVVVVLWAISILLPWKKWFPKFVGPVAQPKQADEDIEMTPVRSST